MLIRTPRVNPGCAEIVTISRVATTDIFLSEAATIQQQSRKIDDAPRHRLFALSLPLFTSALAASPFDGVYRGTFTLAGNGNMRCSNGDVTVRVVDGKFNFGAADSTDRVSVSVGSDGTFSAQSGQRYLQGKIQGSQLTAVVSAQRCNYNWSLTK